MKKQDFFYKASGLFLTENLTLNEFDYILSKGDILPISSDYESWDVDYLEEKIRDVASDLELFYNKGAVESNSISSFIESFVSVAKEVSDKCKLRPEVYKPDGFTNIFDTNKKLIGRVYFNDNYATWTIGINEIEYTNYSEKIEIPSNNTDVSMKIALDLLVDFNKNFDIEKEPVRRKFPKF